MIENKKTVSVGFAVIMSIQVLAATVMAQEAQPPALTAAGQKLEAGYAAQIQSLKAEIEKALPQIDAQKKAAFLEAAKADNAAKWQANALDQENSLKAAAELNLTPFLSDAKLDARLVKFAVLNGATPKGLAEFTQQGAEQVAMIEKLLADPELMKQMLVADGANGNKYGRAMEIYTAIQKARAKSKDGVLQRLALAVALEHAVPLKQDNPPAKAGAPATVDPLKRYLAYEKAYVDGELDPAFKDLTAWELRFVVNGDEPDEISAWGRRMLRNHRPDIATHPDHDLRYVMAVATEIKRTLDDVKYDRPELQHYQNIIMNGGICGRQAFFGMFILRAFGIPTTGHLRTGHGALVLWTPDGWIVTLGSGWGGGSWRGTYTGRTPHTRYHRDLDFQATTQARENQEAFLQVKRAQWLGDLAAETPVYGIHTGVPGFWYGLSLCTQRDIIEKAKAKKLAASGANLGKSNETGEKPVTETVGMADTEMITVGNDGVITIPAAAYSKPITSTEEVKTIKSFGPGQQISLPRFVRTGLGILRGGAWGGEATKGWVGDAAHTTSAVRLLARGWGRYSTWGFRAAITPDAKDPQGDLKLDLGDGVTMEFVYIKPGTFVMGGESGIELPKHEVTITRGFYLGKYEVTQAQYQLIMGENPSLAAKDPNCPVDNVNVDNTFGFCAKLSGKTGRSVRLPTEAEWEYACRAGSKTVWFFGDDPAQLGDYAWYKDNDGGKSHPVGQKKPNPWGLYDIYGNINERVSDIYEPDYYANSPKKDPALPGQTRFSSFEYKVNVPRAATYALTARIVTNHYNQTLNVSANGDGAEVSMALPFTCGEWKLCEPVKLTLKEGENTLQFARNNPPQAGISVKSFTLKPVK